MTQFLAATPTPTTDPANTFYSPGIPGFLAIFFVAAGAILIIFDMVRRVRRVRYRAEIQEKLAQETAAQEPGAKAKAADIADGAPAKPKRPAPPAKPKRD
ncbi:MAG: hypothetical protein ACKORF_03160 [Micrococcales bacterium]